MEMNQISVLFQILQQNMHIQFLPFELCPYLFCPIMLHVTDVHAPYSKVISKYFSSSELLINHLESCINDTHEDISGCAEACDSWIPGQPLFPLVKNKPGDWDAHQSIKLSLFSHLSFPPYSRGDWKKNLLASAALSERWNYIFSKTNKSPVTPASSQQRLIAGKPSCRSLQQNGGQWL